MEYGLRLEYSNATHISMDWIFSITSHKTVIILRNQNYMCIGIFLFGGGELNSVEKRLSCNKEAYAQGEFGNKMVPLSLWQRIYLSNLASSK